MLLLVAAGHSNPEIAKALFISAKTASVHVSNILAKLGVSGRVEAAAVVHRLVCQRTGSAMWGGVATAARVVPMVVLGRAAAARHRLAGSRAGRRRGAGGLARESFHQPSSVSRSSPMPKWWATSWMTVRRTWSATSSTLRQMAQIACR